MARVPSTDANLAIDSLVFLSSCVRDAMANFVSMLYVQHVPDDGTPQCLKTASAMKMNDKKKKLKLAQNFGSIYACWRRYPLKLFLTSELIFD